jgi:hypothetical protein
MKKTVEQLLRHLSATAAATRPNIDHIVDPANPTGIYDHDNKGLVAYAFLALYLIEHPANPHAGDAACLDAYARLVDGWLRKSDALSAPDTPYRFPEWCSYVMVRGLELARDQLDPELCARIEKVIVTFVERDLPRPFFFTAPNHEIWKLQVVWLAGHVLGRPEWREQAEFEAEQLCAWQTPEGFWEEGRHHGPSMRYNSVMLSGLARMAQRTGSAALCNAAEQLARFMGKWVMPDGTSVGAFDGRQPTSPGRTSPGLELAPEGVTLMQRIMQTCERNGWLSDDAPASAHAHWIDTDAAFYLLDVPCADAAPLPMDADGATLENHTPYFDATMARRGPWVAALSSQMSDVPKDTQFIYRLERQNRIELWHEKAAVVVGGGHNLVTAEHPYYNVWVEPGYHAEPGGFSSTGGIASTPEMARRRSKYYPRAASSGSDGDALWLELVFAHATVRFTIRPDGDELVIGYAYQAMCVEELRLALPLLLWGDAAAAVDGVELRDADEVQARDVAQCVTVAAPQFDTTATLTVPDAGQTRALFRLLPKGPYKPGTPQTRGDSPFSLVFVETVLSDPGRAGSGEWRLRVE